MVQKLIYVLIYAGSVLMVYNIYGFISFVRYIRGLNSKDNENQFLYLPIILLVGFLAGYLMVGFFGKPDFIVAGILFGGSVFVYLIYRYLWRVTQWVIDNNKLNAELQAERQYHEAKSDFLGSMSHEMRTPMNVILGLISTLKRNESLDNTAKDKVEKIEYAGHHLLDLINNILEVNELESRELKLKNECFDLEEIIKQLNVNIETLCEQKGIDYHFEIDKELCRQYCGDSLKLKQLLLCFLDNGIKYTEVSGSLEFRIRKLKEEKDKDTISFLIKDTGIGIDEEFLPKLFDKFEKEDESSSNKYGGGGLSLSLAKGLVDLMNGQIKVESKKNEGTAFEVIVDLRRSKKEEETILNPNCLEGYKILVAEDIDENAEIVCDLLEIEGAQTTRARNGKDAYDKYEEAADNYFDAILMDLRMPETDGLQATTMIRSSDKPRSKTIPIIALSANSFDEDIEKSYEAGMNAHLVKPIDADKLYRTLIEQITKGGQQ